MYTHYYHYVVVGDYVCTRSLSVLIGSWFAHRKEVVLSCSLNAVFSALNDSFGSEVGECDVACVAGGVYRPGESGEAARRLAHVISPASVSSRLRRP